MPVDSIENVPYRIGYSFRQPEIVKPVTRTNKRPYFAVDWAASVDKKKTDLRNKAILQRFPSIWRRAAKGKAIRSLGVVGNRKELPSFQELGEAPGPTDKATTSSEVSRGAFGFLDNLITTTGGLIAQSQQLEITKARAQQYPTMLPQGYMPYSNSGIGVLGWTAIVAALGAGTYFFMKNRS
jgi:hypothetical protein